MADTETGTGEGAVYLGNSVGAGVRDGVLDDVQSIKEAKVNVEADLCTNGSSNSGDRGSCTSSCLRASRVSSTTVPDGHILCTNGHLQGTKRMEMNKQPQFWKPKPKSPTRDFRSWSLLVPAMFSAVGFFAFAVLAFSFTELALLPSWFKIGLVILGALCLAVGGEGGTLTTTVEIFRKYRMKETVWWDWTGLVMSLCATLAEFLIAFATLLNVRAQIWSEPMQLWGPIALGLLSALDSYVNFMEYGLFLATYDKRMRQWERDYERWLKKINGGNANVRQDVPGVQRERIQPVQTL